MEYMILHIMPDTVAGHEMFNYFFTLICACNMPVVGLLACMKLIARA